MPSVLSKERQNAVREYMIRKDKLHKLLFIYASMQFTTPTYTPFPVNIIDMALTTNTGCGKGNIKNNPRVQYTHAS